VPLRELPPAVRAELGTFRLEVHVHSDRPADRLVFINGHKYVEGGMVDGKVRVEEITQDGAILSHQGLRFLLKE
jgi:general secretion pathway protein B